MSANKSSAACEVLKSPVILHPSPHHDTQPNHGSSINHAYVNDSGHVLGTSASIAEANEATTPPLSEPRVPYPTMSTELLQALKDGDCARVLELLNADADVNSVNEAGETPLMVASHAGHLDVVQLLLDRGANVDMYDKLGQNAVAHACYGLHDRGNEVMRTLVAAKADVEARCAASAWCGPHDESRCARGNHEDCGKITFDINGQVIQRSSLQTVCVGDTPLLVAARAADADTVRLLIAALATVNVRSDGSGETPLLRACLNSDDVSVKLLVDASADVNAAMLSNGRTPLTSLCFHGPRPSIIQTLIVAKADVNAPGYQDTPPLSLASAAGQYEVVEMLLDAKAEVDARGPGGYTALNKLCASLPHARADSRVATRLNANIPRIVSALLAANASVDVAADDGSLPLEEAVRHRHRGVVSLLLEHIGIGRDVVQQGELGSLIPSGSLEDLEYLTKVINNETT